MVASLRGLPERKTDESVERCIGAEFVLGGVYGGAGVGGLEAEVGERRERVRRSSGTRSRCTSAAKTGHSEFALKLIGDALGELGSDPAGTADHRLVAVGEYSPTLVKKAVVGTGGADKAQVHAMVTRLLPGVKIAGPDAADALAVAITHAHHLATSRRLA